MLQRHLHTLSDDADSLNDRMRARNVSVPVLSGRCARATSSIGPSSLFSSSSRSSPTARTTTRATWPVRPSPMYLCASRLNSFMTARTAAWAGMRVYDTWLIWRGSLSFLIKTHHPCPSSGAAGVSLLFTVGGIYRYTKHSMWIYLGQAQVSPAILPSKEQPK